MTSLKRLLNFDDDTDTYPLRINPAYRKEFRTDGSLRLK